MAIHDSSYPSSSVLVTERPDILLVLDIGIVLLHIDLRGSVPELVVVSSRTSLESLLNSPHSVVLGDGSEDNVHLLERQLCQGMSRTVIASRTPQQDTVHTLIVSGIQREKQRLTMFIAPKKKKIPPLLSLMTMRG
jgi:hypothetical protein